MFLKTGALQRLTTRQQEIKYDYRTLSTSSPEYKLYQAIINDSDLNGINTQNLNLNHRLFTTGATPIIAAIVFGKIDAVRFLLDHDADITLTDNRYQANAFHWAFIVALHAYPESVPNLK